MNETQFIGLLIRACEQAGSQAAWAKAHGVSAAYVSDVVNYRKSPGSKIVEAMGFERVTVYRRRKG